MRTCPLSFCKTTQAAIAKIICGSALVLLLPAVVSAASLALTPGSGSYPVGSTFTVSVTASSETPLNAVSGVVAFPANILEVVSLSKNQSVISLWVQEPTFSNSLGTVQFEGVAPNPGYHGALGNILGVTFRVKAEGLSLLTFSAGSILANDGEGTEILSSKGSATFTLMPLALPSPVVASPTADRAIPQPVVVSATHKNGEWSNLTEGTFTFTYPSEVTSLRLLVDEHPTTIPVVTYTPPISSRTIKDLVEGVSYLHVQYKTADGWSDVLHYKLQIDTLSPDPVVITEVTPGTFTFATNDASAGIARYEVSIDDDGVTTVDATTPTYTPVSPVVGTHTLTVRAIDIAGNSTVSTYSFVSTLPTVLPPAEVVADVVVPTLPSLMSAGIKAIALLSIIIPLVALVGLLGFLVYSLWRVSGGLKRRIALEVAMATETANQLFSQLDTDCARDIDMLQKVSIKRKLTREEVKVLKQLQQKKAVIEQYLSRDILCKNE